MTMVSSMVRPMVRSLLGSVAGLSEGVTPFLKTFSGASAAYSLRQLSSPSTDVVRVRRSSDDAEQDFTAAQVSNGALVDWVGTGGTDNGFVTTWYDQRVPTSQDRMYFDGVDDYVSVSGMTASANYFGACTISAKIFIEDASTVGAVFALGAAAYRLYTNTNWFLNYATDTGVAVTTGLHDVSVTFNASGEATSFSLDGVEVWTGTAPAGSLPTTVFYIGARESGGAGLFFEGTIYDFAITGSSVKNFSFNGYGNLDEDWTDQVGSNNGTVNGSPRRCLSDLTLANDATQTTTANQPAIVTAGVVVTSGGKPAIDFDGVSQHFATPDYIVELSANDAQVIMVKEADSQTNARYALTEGDGALLLYSSNFIMGAPTGGSSGVWVNGSNFGSAQDAAQDIRAFEKTGGAGTGSRTIQAYKDGAVDGASGAATINAETSIGTFIAASADATAGFYDGTMQEIVTFKNTDNSITDMMDTINTQYGVY